jgi:signal transduction histidine kinase
VGVLINQDNINQDNINQVNKVGHKVGYKEGNPVNSNTDMVHHSLSLKWRIALLCGLAIALLGITSSLLAYWVVRSRILTNIERSIIVDAKQVARTYEEGLGVAPILDGPTGGLFVQIYSPQGTLLATSRQRFADAPIDVDRVFAARRVGVERVWRGRLADEPVMAALEPVSFGVVAVVAPTNFLSLLLREIAQVLALVAVLLSAVGGIAGYFVAQWSMRPVSRLAMMAEGFSADRLKLIPYRGPDDEVGRLTRAYNDLIGQLNDALEAQRVFLAETSHELRTPLTSMRGFLDRALRRANPEAQQDLQDARRIADTLSRLVADILQLSRGEIIREVVPHLLDPFEDLLVPIAEEFKGVQLEGQAGELLVGDPEQLQQLLRNLIANAVRACGDDPSRVILRCHCSADSKDQNEVVLEIRDNGPGIAPDVLPDIFRKFYKGAGGGAGLGLAIAKQIAHAHDGDIQVESERGVGTVFFVHLPSFADSGEDEM